jgi:glycerate kinase
VLLAGVTAYVESAQACGLHLLAADERDPRRTTSFGLGLLLIGAVEYGAREVVIGLGGSATNDAGAGMLAAIDVTPLDAAGYAVGFGGLGLLDCERVAGAARLRGASLVAASDVDNPLTGPDGATAVYGPQKGASPEDLPLLDAVLGRFAVILERDLPTCPPGLAGLPGTGAAGGIGAAIAALGGTRESGFGLVRRLTRLAEAIGAADVVITGEGRFDGQSLRGKVVGEVARLAARQGVSCAVLAGSVEPDPPVAGLPISSITEFFGDSGRAHAEAADGLRGLATRLARQWHNAQTAR